VLYDYFGAQQLCYTASLAALSPVGLSFCNGCNVANR